MGQCLLSVELQLLPKAWVIAEVLVEIQVLLLLRFLERLLIR